MSTGRKETKTYKVLLVDDNQDLLQLTAVMIRQLGFEVLIASTGEAALETLKHTTDVDVLFTDVVMPGISGVQLGHEACELIPNLKVILVSGYPAPERFAGHGSIHDFQFLRKPYRMTEVEKVLSKTN